MSTEERNAKSVTSGYVPPSPVGHQPQKSIRVGDAITLSVSARRFAIAFLSAVTALAFAAVPAFASRSFQSQISGPPAGAEIPGPFVNPVAITVDGADDVWVDDPGTNTNPLGVISEFNSAGQYLAEQTGLTSLPNPANFKTIALDDASGNLYVGNWGPVTVEVLEHGTGPFKETWETEDNRGFIYVAVDNSGGPTQGRAYVARSAEGPQHLQAFNADHEPSDFTGSAPYIEENRITGTPSGPIGSIGGITVDKAGRFYVIDNEAQTIDVFNSEGIFLQTITGAEVPGGFSTSLTGIAVDPNGNILVVDSANNVVDEFESGGGFLEAVTGPSVGTPFGQLNGGIAVNSSGDLFISDEIDGVVDVFGPNSLHLPAATTSPAADVERTSAGLHGHADPLAAGNIIGCAFEYVDKASQEATGYAVGATTVPCLDGSDTVVGTPTNPIEGPIDVHAEITGLSPAASYRYRLAVSNSSGTSHGISQVIETPPSVSALRTDPVSELTNFSATLNGSFTREAGIDTHYFFEYGTSTNYGKKVPAPPALIEGTTTGPQGLGEPVANLVPNTTYHYRVVAENEFGKTVGEDRTFTTFRSPSIESFSSSGVTATSANLQAQINPEGFETSCHFEYGVSSSYGASAPCPQTLSGEIGQPVEVQLSGLQGVTYHFRVVAESQWGTTVSEDQTFTFFPPSCPNASARQLTGASYLPDCRAYELVSPENAHGTLLFSGGPNSGTATNPSRLSYVGLFSSPLENAKNINTTGDLYVATRTDEGWASKYIGLPGNEASCMGDPPNNPFAHASSSNKIQNSVLTDPGMSRFMDWISGEPVACSSEGNGTGDASWSVALPSNAPYLWDAEGNLLQHLPSDLASTPEAAKALACHVAGTNGFLPTCTSDVSASGDLTHVVFSSNQLAFASGGLEVAPGSAYDDDVATGTVTLISELPGGASIPQDPGHPDSGEFIRFPAVSSDGSHILMSTASPTSAVHLYMSIDDAPAIAIAGGEAVNYVGMTPDGSKVYFTSAQQLLPADADTSIDLYMWSQKGEEEGRPLTLISAADNDGNAGEAGNTDDCNASWVAECGVGTFSAESYSHLNGNVGGNGISDNAIAAANGDIYFYSPEQLDGDHGVLGQENLYVYRDARAHFVTTLNPGGHCTLDPNQESTVCSDGPVVRLQVSPDDSHVAFVTDTQLTSYDNAGHLEMYSYLPATGAITCDSCRPDGKPATADLQASQDGLFMTDDGRTFFSTSEALVPQDTNEGEDVYEFAEGRPRLITPGTGTVTVGGVNLVSVGEIPGLVGVSANGTDVYFSTYDPLISQDHNGNFLRFYDARSDGGFLPAESPPPCVAAEECHGQGSSAPAPAAQGTAASLVGGNATHHLPARHKKKHAKKKRKRPRHRTASKRRDGDRGGAK